MLTVPDLINIQYIPEITDISLILMVDFYEQYLCKRFWVFELADGQKVKLFFKDTSEIFMFLELTIYMGMCLWMALILLMA